MTRPTHIPSYMIVKEITQLLIRYMAIGWEQQCMPTGWEQHPSSNIRLPVLNLLFDGIQRVSIRVFPLLGHISSSRTPC